MGRDRDDQLELEHGHLCGRGQWTNGGLGEQERGQIQEGIWWEVSEEAIYYDSRSLVRH